MTPESYGPSSGPGAARILTQARESSRRLQGAVSVTEGWWTITSAVLIFVMIAGGLRTRHGIGSGLALGVVRWPCCWRGAAERRCGTTLVGTTSGSNGDLLALARPGCRGLVLGTSRATKTSAALVDDCGGAAGRPPPGRRRCKPGGQW